MPQAARRYLAPAALLALCAAASFALQSGRPEGPPLPLGLADMPLTFGDFRGRELPLNRSIFAYLGADEMVDRLYVNEETEQAVTVSVVFARGWRALHSPHDCFKNQGWRLLGGGALDIPSRRANARPIHGSRMVMDNGEARIAVVYAFATRSGTTGSWLRHSLRMAVGGGQAGGALIVAVATSPDPRADGSALEACATLVRESHKYLEKEWQEQE